MQAQIFRHIFSIYSKNHGLKLIILQKFARNKQSKKAALANIRTHIIWFAANAQMHFS